MHIKLVKGRLTLIVEKEQDNRPTDKETIQLTLTEYQVLEELLKNQGQHIHKRKLIKAGWPHSIVCDNALNMVIMSLRKKLLPFDFIKITTIYRFGYSLNFTL